MAQASITIKLSRERTNKRTYSRNQTKIKKLKLFNIIHTLSAVYVLFKVLVDIFHRCGSFPLLNSYYYHHHHYFLVEMCRRPVCGTRSLFI